MGRISPAALRSLEELTTDYLLSIPSGDLLLLDGRWYVAHTGLLRLARRSRCAGINVRPVTTFSDPSSQRWKFNRRRALFVLGKIDEILAWEQQGETERDTKFVELGRYLCEVRAGQYWRLEELKCFDEFLERRFPGSRRKAYYLMPIHEHIPPKARKELKKVGWTKGLEPAKLERRDREQFDCATW